MTETTPPKRALHPLVHAGAWLVSDLVATLAFVALYAVTHSVYVATGFGIAVGAGQVAWLKFRGSPIDLLQWLSLFLVVVFGSTTLLTRDPRFVMVKPTLIYCAVGIVMLRRGWMARYIPEAARGRSEDITIAFGYIWAAMMFATGAANLGFALLTSTQTWVWFMGIFPLASKITLFAVQYGATRALVVRRTHAALAAE